MEWFDEEAEAIPVEGGVVAEDESLSGAPTPNPANVGTTSTGPAASSESDSVPPRQFQEPQPVTDAEMSGEAAEEPSYEFPAEHRQALDGLLFIGKLTDTFTWAGHSFSIRTLDGDAEIEIGLLHKPFLDTIANMKAYKMLLVAACIEKVDGQPVALPLGPEDSGLEARFNVVRRWYQPTIDVVYERALALTAGAEKAANVMGSRISPLAAG